MKLKLIQLTVCIFLVLTSYSAHAVISCSAPTSTGFTTAYSPTGVVPNATQGTVTFTCTRSAAGDATTILLRANNGVNTCAGSNDASFGGNCINYEAYQNSTCTTVWTANNNASSITVTLLPVLSAQPITVNFWGCITVAGQNRPAGNYTDTVTMTLRSTAGVQIAGATGTFRPTIINPASCSITSIANVAFGTYTAFRTTNLVAPAANIVLNCTTALPYRLSLDATSGVVVGLNYTLALSATNSRGTGPGQTHTITGTMPANQAGTCTSGSCTGSQQRTLTITY